MAHGKVIGRGGLEDLDGIPRDPKATWCTGRKIRVLTCYDVSETTAQHDARPTTIFAGNVTLILRQLQAGICLGSSRLQPAFSWADRFLGSDLEDENWVAEVWLKYLMRLAVTRMFMNRSSPIGETETSPSFRNRRGSRLPPMPVITDDGAWWKRGIH
ncbi:hypothetical protein HYDPIDRAFT_39783 [Hydnomerulius pinastri MD-312]|uniref:Uncharacterized protein n=1 Tax=Hydnomerulius pinastri MD-312 TaxID=994086 RepID=A0A0C9W2F0_9AGAM|nr:hypothetical protein HYDPIDRAFT_39783 [Hydnomerulius pinastri MD-312]